MWLVLWLALSLLVPVQAPAPAPRVAAPGQPAGTLVWIGRYEAFEQYLASAKIVRIEDIGTGVTHPRRAFFEPGGLAASAIVKNLPPGRQQGYWESYKSEIAAYKLDRLLDLNMVPPTIEKRVDGVLMSAQLWVESTGPLKKAQEQGGRAPDTDAFNRQVYRQRAFDDLVGNIDENAGNILIDPVWHFVLVDHSRCFAESKMPFPLTRIDRAFFDKLKSLDPAAVRSALRGLVDSGQIENLLKRRTEIVSTFDKLAAQKGAAQVFVE